MKQKKYRLFAFLGELKDAIKGPEKQLIKTSNGMVHVRKYRSSLIDEWIERSDRAEAKFNAFCGPKWWDTAINEAIEEHDKAAEKYFRGMASSAMQRYNSIYGRTSITDHVMFGCSDEAPKKKEILEIYCE